MKFLATFSTLALLLFFLPVEAQQLQDATEANPMADPFAANTRPELPPPPALKTPGIELPPVASFPKSPQQLPASLRILLIHDTTQALLGSAEAGSLSIPVANGKPVRIAGQNYSVEVTRTEVRLYSAEPGSQKASGKKSLVWEGTLSGIMPVTVQGDIAQLQYTPPLSAGVSPGRASRSNSTGVVQAGAPRSP